VEGDVLTTLSDNDVMWVYFNVPEARYLEYQASKDKDELQIELMLANHQKFPQAGSIGAIEADFDNKTGNIAFRGDFPNPDRLLRHGQTGTVLLSRIVKDAIVIPQRATYEILARKYAYVVEMEAVKADDDDRHDGAHDEDEDDHEDEKGDHERRESKHDDDHDDAEKQQAEDQSQHHVHRGVVRQREIVIQNEQDDIFLIKEGLSVDDRIILEGIQQVRDGDVIEYEFVEPAQALENLKFHAE
jgi:membrane fusion protein (multidrug efflux system)